MILLSRLTLLCSFIICFTTQSSFSLELVEKKISFIFKILDFNKDGKLDIKDIDRVAENIAVKEELQIEGKKHIKIRDSLRSMLAAVLEELGAKEIGFITPKQWIEVWNPYVTNPEVVKEWQKNYEEGVFTMFDINDDGIVTDSEFVKLYESFGLEKSNLSKAFTLVAGINGTVNRQEFSQLWKEYFSSKDLSSKGNFATGHLSWD